MGESIESEMYRISCRHFSKMQPGPQMIKTTSGSIQAHYQPGQKEPIIWVPGFLGTMTGAKVEFLEKVNNEELQRPLWKFNYSNIGESKGDFTFENWVADAQTVLNQASEESPVIIVASSMGAFISINLANRFPEKVKAMFLCAPAKDFMKNRFDEINEFPGEFIPIPGTYDHSTGMGGIPKTFFGSIPQFWIKQNSLKIKCPVHILHPENDELCPISGSEELVNFIGKNSNLEILKNATHTMKEENDLLQFKTSLCDFLNKI